MKVGMRAISALPVWAAVSPHTRRAIAENRRRELERVKARNIGVAFGYTEDEVMTVLRARPHDASEVLVLVLEIDRPPEYVMRALDETGLSVHDFRTFWRAFS